MTITTVGTIAFGIHAWVIGCLLFAAWRRATGTNVPLSFFGWAIAVCMGVAAAFPSTFQHAWRESSLQGAFAQRLDTLLTAGFGMAAGVIVARLAATSLYPLMDRRLFRQDVPTGHARQLIGAFALAGCLLGWQAMTTVGVMTGLIALCLSWVLRSTSSKLELADWSVWIWLAVLIYSLTLILRPQIIDPTRIVRLELYHPLAALLVLALAYFAPDDPVADQPVTDDAVTDDAGETSGKAE